MPDLWLPQHIRPAVKRISVVFYVNSKINRIMVGFPEQFPAPNGWQKIVCTTAAEVDLWDKRLREQEKFDNEMTEEQRDAIEAPMEDYARKELVTLMMNARTPLNREFCRFALQQLDEKKAARKTRQESVMHICAYEDGK